MTAEGVVSLELPARSASLRSSPSVPLRAVQGVLGNPLLRNGYLLTLSSGLTGAVGLLYWTVTTWKYDPAAVGSNTASISLMTLVSAVAQLNMSSVMVRFVPTAGQQTRRLVIAAHLACGCVALLAGTGAVLAVPIISPGSNFLDTRPAVAMFLVAIVAYPVFVIQDGVLVGLGQAGLVVVKNLAFAAIKVLLVVVLAGIAPQHGIFASWVLGVGAVELAVGAYLFGTAIPSRQRRERGMRAEMLPPPRQIARFVMADYGGAVCSIASMDVMEIMVISVCGAERNAYFAIAWIIAYSLHLINISMGTSLVAETARDPARLSQAVHHVVGHTAKLQVPTVALTVLVAPVLLGVFGAGYRSAADTLRLLALAALPHLLVSIAINSARVQGRLKFIFSVQAAQCVLVLTLTWLLLRVVGPIAPGWAWLVAQCVLAAAMLIRHDLWYSIDGHPPDRRTLFMPVLVQVLRLLAVLRVRWLLDRALEWNRARRAGALPAESLGSDVFGRLPAANEWICIRTVPNVSDVSVTLLGPEHGPPAAVLKLARSRSGATELQAQRHVLTELATNPRLDEQWRALLPRILAFHHSAEGTLALESYRPGVDLAEVLAAEPDRFEELTSTALVAIAPLHCQTATRVVVDDACLLPRWVGEPVTELTQACQRMDPRLLPDLDRLRGQLRDDLAGRRLPVSWTHGDYTPGNVRLAGAGGPVSGIIDWGGARPGRLALIDKYLMVLAASCIAERAELGPVVTARLTAHGLSDRERNALCTAHRLSNGGDCCQRCLDGDLDEQTAILLAWLHHVNDLWRKCGTYRRHRVWWASNVAPVLRAIADDDACGSRPDHTGALHR